MIKTGRSARFSEDKIKAHFAGTFPWWLSDTSNPLKKLADVEDVGMTIVWTVCESLTVQNISVDAVGL
jgi:hypothetical protein